MKRLNQTSYPVNIKKNDSIRYHHGILETKERICLVLALVLSLLGALALMTAPKESGTQDSRILQQELARNAAGLESMQENDDTTDTTMSSDFADDAETPLITAVGDSVMLGAAPAILDAFPGSTVDAKESRQVWDAPDVLDKILAEGKMNDTVVIALGINSSFTEETGQEILDDLGDRTIYWIIPYGKSISYLSNVQETLESLQENNENLTLLDWPSTAEQHPEWFYDDGIHLNPDGQEGYASFLKSAICGQTDDDDWQ